jgi:hypothetical protein
LNIAKISQDKYKTPRWHHFYGGWDDAEDKTVVESMNKHPEIASRFKGAVFLSVEMVDAITQGNFKEKMAANEIMRPLAPIRYKICAEIYSVHNLHYEDKGENGSHSVHLNWGGKCAMTKETKLNCGMLEYYQYLELEEEFTTHELNLLPDIVISVLKPSKSNHVSYFRLKPTDYISSGTITDKYLLLNVDKAVSQLHDDGAGILHFKLAVNKI